MITSPHHLKMLQPHQVYPQQQHFTHTENNWLSHQQQQTQQQSQQHVNPYSNQGRAIGLATHPSPAPMATPGIAMAHTITDEDAKIYTWIVELVQGDRRESALLELSKKREQVDDLAVILWHSVGQYDLLKYILFAQFQFRSHDILTPGNYLRVSFTHAVQLDCRCIEPCL